MQNPFSAEINSALRLRADEPPPDSAQVIESGIGALQSWFAVTDLASASIIAASQQLAAIALHTNRHTGSINVDRRLASFWFASSIRPQGFQVPGLWDPVAGDYETSDGWIRLHTNAPHHRRAALGVLGVDVDREAVARAVADWPADELEQTIVAANGCAASMRSESAWAEHVQGKAIASEPLIHWERSKKGGDHSARHEENLASAHPELPPLTGIRVLDLTRVLAGPAASRFLARFGAEVLRIDPPDWDEPGVVPEVTIGKRCAGLDLRSAGDRKRFETLLAGADVLLHGYRPGALGGLGYDVQTLQQINPRLINVSLCAYGWSGPWAGRRGFDSLVQMSNGIADTGMRQSGNAKPTPLPVQALDHATGYLLAAAVLRALRERRHKGDVWQARLSLARTGILLAGPQAPHADSLPEYLARETADDLDSYQENSAWGAARRLRFPVHIEGVEQIWPHPAGQLRSAPATWS